MIETIGRASSSMQAVLSALDRELEAYDALRVGIDAHVLVSAVHLSRARDHAVRAWPEDGTQPLSAESFKALDEAAVLTSEPFDGAESALIAELEPLLARARLELESARRALSPARRGRKVRAVGAGIACAALMLLGVAEWVRRSAQRPVFSFPGIDVMLVTQAFGHVRFNRGISGNALRIAGREYGSGIGTHAKGTIEIRATAPGGWLEGACGLDESAGTFGSVRCRVESRSGAILAESRRMTGGMPPFEFRVPIERGERVVLKADDAGDGIDSDHVDWINLRISPRHE